MALPSRAEQIKRVSELLDREESEGVSLEELATIIVDGYLDLLTKGLKKPLLIPHVGSAFKHPAISGVWHVAYQHGPEVWICSATSKYGAWMMAGSDFWGYAEVSTAKAGEPGNNKDGWQVGDKVSRRQRQFIYEVVATSDKGVLLRDMKNLGATPMAESNENMKLYYRKEIPMAEVEW